MKPVWWIAAAGAACWMALVAVLGGQAVPDASLGLAGPLGATGASWVLVERTYRRNPAQLTSLMVTAFAGKLVFFGAYVAIGLSVLSRRPVPFVLSFTVSFIALHLTEAVCLRRLFASGPR
jgi:hypothetical protein